MKPEKKPRTKYGVVFSQFNKEVLSEPALIEKQHGRGAIEDMYSKYWQAAYGLLPKHPDSITVFFGSYYGLNAFKRKEWLSVFIESPSLIDFFNNSKLADSSISSMIFASQNLLGILDSGVAFHIAGRKNSILVTINELPDKFKTAGATHVFQFYGDGSGFFLFDPFLTKGIADQCKEQGQEFIFVMNALMYISAFPHKLRDGVPDLTKPYTESARVATMESSKEMDEDYSLCKITPHMRRGHFRLLKDDRYKEKHGNLVYVRPHMVRGHAATITNYRED
jgi:hypothetical protein